MTINVCRYLLTAKHKPNYLHLLFFNVPVYLQRRRAINNDIVCGLQLKVYKIRSSRFSRKEWFVASENIVRHLSTARIETFTSHSNCLKGFKMAKPLLFSLMLVASYTVLTEV